MLLHSNCRVAPLPASQASRCRCYCCRPCLKQLTHTHYSCSLAAVTLLSIMTRQQWIGAAAATAAVLQRSCAFVPLCHSRLPSRTAPAHSCSRSSSTALNMNQASDVLLTPPDRTGLMDSVDDMVNFDGQMPFPSDLPRPPFEFQVNINYVSCAKQCSREQYLAAAAASWCAASLNRRYYLFQRAHR